MMRDGSQATTLLLADELAMVREGLAALCAAWPRYRIIADCGDGDEAFRLIHELRPDIAVLDLQLPRLFPLEIVRRARQEGIETRAVILAHRGDRKTVLEALRGGASAFVIKSGPARHLHDALNQVRAGSIYVSPLLEMEKLFAPERGGEDPIELLSSREHQVFTLLVEGFRAKEIAARLDLSPKTVDTYRASLMRKLDIHDSQFNGI
jgi:DNA-binding NarL/FixJ family response regulator